MRRAALLLAVLGGLLAFPTGALASDRDGRTCDYAQTWDEDETTVVDNGTTEVVVYTGSGGTTEDMNGSGGAGTVAGGCVNTGTGAFQGGTAEVGAGEDPATGTNDPDATDAYAVVDGDNDNVVAGRTDGGGYVGASNYETETKESCDDGATEIVSAGGITVYSPGDQDEGGSGSNSGDCFSVRSGAGSSNPEVLTIEGIPLICGNTTGQNWDESTRDGCTIP